MCSTSQVSLLSYLHLLVVGTDLLRHLAAGGQVGCGDAVLCKRTAAQHNSAQQLAVSHPQPPAGKGGLGLFIHVARLHSTRSAQQSLHASSKAGNGLTIVVVVVQELQEAVQEARGCLLLDRVDLAAGPNLALKQVQHALQRRQIGPQGVVGMEPACTEQGGQVKVVHGAPSNQDLLSRA